MRSYRVVSVVIVSRDLGNGWSGLVGAWVMMLSGGDIEFQCATSACKGFGLSRDPERLRRYDR